MWLVDHRLSLVGNQWQMTYNLWKKGGGGGCGLHSKRIKIVTITIYLYTYFPICYFFIFLFCLVWTEIISLWHIFCDIRFYAMDVNYIRCCSHSKHHCPIGKSLDYFALCLKRGFLFVSLVFFSMTWSLTC